MLEGCSVRNTKPRFADLTRKSGGSLFSIWATCVILDPRSVFALRSVTYAKTVRLNCLLSMRCVLLVARTLDLRTASRFATNQLLVLIHSLWNRGIGRRTSYTYKELKWKIGMLFCWDFQQTVLVLRQTWMGTSTRFRDGNATCCIYCVLELCRLQLCSSARNKW